MIRKILLVTALFFGALHAKEMPTDKRLVEGMLPNGFSYYIMHNEKPKDMVEFRLLINVGSLEEDDDQRGLAHFIEHMAFNGTEHFKKNELISFLESIGLKFGGDLNANTGYTRTLYKLTVPVKGENVEKAFTVLKDWADGVQFDPEEFNKERGVILEEKRLRNSPSFRIYEQFIPLFFEGSKYKDRMVIGKEDVLKNAPVQRAVDFYKKWYRPELMSLIVVGDMNVTQTEKRIRETFGSLKNSNHTRPVSRLVPEHNTTRVMTLTDRELSNNSADIYFVERRLGTVTEVEKKEDILDWVVMLMFNLNAQKVLMEPGTKALSMRMADSTLTPLKHAFDFSVSYKAEEREAAFYQLASLMARFEKFGFSKEDLETVRKQMLTLNENSHKEYPNTKSATFASQIARSIESGAVFVDEMYDYNLSKKILNALTLHDINARFREIVKNRDRIILFTDTLKEPMSKKKALAFITKAYKEVSVPKNDTAAPKQLMSETLPDRHIVEKKYDKKHHIYSYRLENNVTVSFMPTKLKKNEVLLSAVSLGGSSNVPLNDLNNTKKAASWVVASAPGVFKPYQLKSLLADKKLGYNFAIGRFYERVEGSSSSQDLESLMQLIYLQVTQPKIDPAMANRLRNSLYSRVAEADRNPVYRFRKALLSYYFKKNPRIRFDTKESIANLDTAQMLARFKQKFSDMNHFHFVIVGDTTPQQLEPLIARYLGNLPTGRKDEMYDSRPYDRLHGKEKFVKHFNTTEIANISMQYRSKLPFSIETMAQMDAVKNILTVRLRNLIREEKSGTYGVGVGCDMLRELGDVTVCSIDFAADPERVDELVSSVKKVLNDFFKEGPTLQELKNYKTEFSVQEKLMKKENRYWSTLLLLSAKFGTTLEEYLNFSHAVEMLNRESVRDTAKKLFSGDELIAERLPEKE